MFDQSCTTSMGMTAAEVFNLIPLNQCSFVYLSKKNEKKKFYMDNKRIDSKVDFFFLAGVYLIQ